ncbi:MAG TPA: carbonic anhydrase family protein [Nitrospirae bacterium]|nr:carbonic anhydrase family protein [Nitrospirota bacterium]HDL20227.1 carbonic anhydrase family protein [Nitrospirota bacterium]HDZ01163.1 carbonic anhydrase family protein [Nitrospirota bacterium]
MKKVFVLLLGALIISTGLVIAGGKAHWGYSGHEGPAHWGDLSAEYSICGSGKNQSPINLTGMIEADLPAINFNYKNSSLEVVNNGHTIQANYAGGSTIRIDGKTFKLIQFHFHTPSENNIEGKSFPMEAHLVHADNDGNLAVVSVMFTKGKANLSVGKVWEHMPKKAGKTNTVSGTSINIMDMLPKNKAYYRFNGSLTTPPCTEGVRWFVLKDSVQVSADQVKEFHSVMHHDNNRPIQPRYARPVMK